MSLSLDPPVDYHDREGGKEARKEKVGKMNKKAGKHTFPQTSREIKAEF